LAQLGAKQIKEFATMSEPDACRSFSVRMRVGADRTASDAEAATAAGLGGTHAES